MRCEANSECVVKDGTAMCNCKLGYRKSGSVCVGERHNRSSAWKNTAALASPGEHDCHEYSVSCRIVIAWFLGIPVRAIALSSLAFCSSCWPNSAFRYPLTRWKFGSKSRHLLSVTHICLPLCSMKYVSSTFLKVEKKKKTQTATWSYFIFMGNCRILIT